MFKKNLSGQRSLSLRTTVFIACLFLTLMVVFLMDFKPVLAQVDPGINAVQDNITLSTDDPRLVAARIIRIALSVLGIIAVGLILYAGFLWMTSGGDEDKVSRAKKYLINAVIGLAIILSAWGIATFIIGQLINATGGHETTPPPGNGEGGGGGLGNGPIQSHYPERNAMGVPRNTNIIITFKEEIKLEDVIVDGGTETNGTWTGKLYVDDNHFEIYRSDCTCTDPLDTNCNCLDSSKGNADCQEGQLCNRQFNEGPNNPLSSDQVSVATKDHKTFVFTPPILGSSEKPVWYTVYVGSDIYKKSNGDSIWKYYKYKQYYDWEFEVSTELDLSPPHVVNVFPEQNNDFMACMIKNNNNRDICGVAKNAVPSITFNEVINPVTATGQTSNGFNNIKILNTTDGTIVQGTFLISDDYKTVEFIADTKCGTNSCGEDIYCLPDNADLVGIIRPATLLTCTDRAFCLGKLGEGYDCLKTPGSTKLACQQTTGKKYYYPLAIEFPDGLVDAANNSLDGNTSPAVANKLGGDGNAQGPADLDKDVDNFYWQFYTSAKMDLSPPLIDGVSEGFSPNINAEGVALDQIIEIPFNERLMKTSLKAGCIPPAGEEGSECYLDLYSTKDPDDPNNVYFWVNAFDKPEVNPTKTSVQLKHDNFKMGDIPYTVSVSSKVKDLFQNCYQPCRGPNCSCIWDPINNKCSPEWSGYPSCINPGTNP